MDGSTADESRESVCAWSFIGYKATQTPTPRYDDKTHGWFFSTYLQSFQRVLCAVGVGSLEQINDTIQHRATDGGELVLSDQVGVGRGKCVPVQCDPTYQCVQKLRC